MVSIDDFIKSSFASRSLYTRLQRLHSRIEIRLEEEWNADAEIGTLVHNAMVC
jgi:hypothetical protein